MLLNPWGLLGLLAIPAIIAFHLYRSRHRPVAVTGLFLYGVEQRTLAAGRTRRPLVWRGSLWLELLAALACTAWLCDLRLGAAAQAQHVVIVLDSRLRIQAAGDDGTCADRLRAAVDRRLAALHGDDRVTIIASGGVPRLLAGPSADPAVARSAVAAWRAEASWHDLDPALALAADLAGPGASIVLASDRRPNRLPATVALISRGQAAAASGFADARRIGAQIAVRVYAHGGPCARTLVLAGPGGELARLPVAVPAGEQTLFQMPIPAAAMRLPVTVRLDGSDPLPADDRVELLPADDRPVLVRVLSGVEPVGGRRPVASALAAIAGVRLVEAGDTPDIAIGRSLPTGSDDQAWAVAIAPGKARPVLGPFLARRGHPLMADLDGVGAVWAGGGELDAVDGRDVLLAAGDTVLVDESRAGRGRRITIHCDSAAGTVANHPLWPALWANLVAARRASLPGIAERNPRCDRPLLVTAPPGASAITVQNAAGAQRIAVDAQGTALVPGFATAGRYDLLADGRPLATVSALALDPRQGDLAEAMSQDVAAQSTPGQASTGGRGAAAHLIPLVLAAAALIGAWTLFRREG
jgi:hypothetical protein